jgi:alkylation response protein AidB-like acyl-CoA dehydrogenase
MRVLGDAAIPPRPDPLDEDQLSLRRSVAEFASRELGQDLEHRDHEASFSREEWLKCAGLDLLGLPVPPEYGGLGAGAVTIAAALEGLGYGCSDNGLIFSMGAQMWACEMPLVHFGTEEQKQRYLPAMCDGSLIAAHGMTEPESGSDAFSLRTTVSSRDGSWILNGSKAFVTNAPESDLFVVFATSDRNLGFGGLSAFLVPRDAPGLTVGQPYSKMGLRTSHLSELFFSDCQIPAEARLGGEGAGMAIFVTSMRWERSLILAPAVGTMRRQLEGCVRYARERSQFGQPIGSFQSVSNRIVEMKLRLETSHLMLYRMASLLDDGSATDLDASLTKLHLSESFVQSSLDAQQIYGGYGYLTEMGVERDLRDALGGRLYSGTSDMQRNVIARHLGL